MSYMIQKKVTHLGNLFLYHIKALDYPKTSFTFFPISAGESTT